MHLGGGLAPPSSPLPVPPPGERREAILLEQVGLFHQKISPLALCMLIHPGVENGSPTSLVTDSLGVPRHVPTVPNG